ncbi:MAG: hypothetical protein GEU87_20570 [Alphaproteobacteria bacterium]|nr:hypothetical protein [Alphaproteobacteria bacterium]
MDQIAIDRSAKLIIGQYGADARARAATKSDAMVARGDLAGAAVWSAVLRAIVEIQVCDGRTKH